MLITLHSRRTRSATTAYGHTFDPASMRWKWRGQLKNINLDFEHLAKRAPNLVEGAQEVLAWVAENRGDSDLVNSHSRFIHLVDHCGPDGECVAEISTAQILNYQAHPASANGRLGAVAGLLRRWHDLEQPGVTTEAIALLQSMRLRGNAKGTAVRTMDPRTGPLTDLERESFFAALSESYAKGSISLESYSLGLLVAVLAPRPVQAAALKACDLKWSTSEAGYTSFKLLVPRAKQGDQLARLQFTERPLTSDIGAIVQLQARSAVSAYGTHFVDPLQVPLFPASVRAGDEPEGFEFHRTATAVGGLVSRTVAKIGARSERTGERLAASAVRFRRTIGTNAAKEGHGPYVIAALLDHTDTQNAGVYTETSVEFVENLDRSMAFQLAPLAQAFTGVLVARESDAQRGDDPSSRITGPNVLSDDRAVGTCGSHGFCALAAPLACYTCRFFQPWLEGPHDAVLEWLLDWRARQVSNGDRVISRIRDRTILAVAAVVSACAMQEEATAGA